MCIAQHFVAGEEELRPTANSDTETLSTDAINLPWVILRAVHQASRIDGIPARARAVLAALARTVDAKNPYGQIFARRELLTERAMQSERTFYRSLADLEAAGLVERPAQRRYVQAGLFGRAYLHLTERAAILLGLIEAPGAQGEEPTAAAPAEGFPPPSDKVAGGGISKDLFPPSFQKRQPGQPPLDLQRLRSLGFRDFLIFKLMREAREKGKRLSDVVEATWEHLKKANRPICYLRALLTNTVDFSFQVRSRHAQLNAERAAVEERQIADSLVRQVAGAAFVDASGQRKFLVDADGLSLSVYHVEEGVARREAGQWQLRFAEALRSGKIRVAEEADIEAFAQARRQVAAASRTVAEAPRVVTETITDHLTLLKGALRRFSPALAKTA
ncbi:hypothetical protein [Paraburkholderia aromaticivorans]|uniref:hypothetical protein n=1 Tax=Paraburkholderia aromaticivorans TaxID=2026199 RepID=UPI0014561C64|nr:hypothetical protein [Paraburkholderia aromaticivorans]